MTTAYDVPADVLIGKLSGYIKENIKEVTAPEWSAHVKTGSHVERVPQVPDWWYVRTASLLRKLYMNGPVGVQRLRKEYGGRKRKGDAPAHHRKAGGSIIRTSLQQLEKAGLVDKVDKSGRVVSKKGRSLLDAMSTQIKKDLDREKPELKAY
jgi:small subunit ribosomal protein S19e